MRRLVPLADFVAALWTAGSVLHSGRETWRLEHGRQERSSAF